MSPTGRWLLTWIGGFFMGFAARGFIEMWADRLHRKRMLRDGARPIHRINEP